MPRAVITGTFDYEVPNERGTMIHFKPTNGLPINVTQAQLDAIVARGAGHEVPVEGKALPNPRTRKRTAKAEVPPVPEEKAE